MEGATLAKKRKHHQTADSEPTGSHKKQKRDKDEDDLDCECSARIIWPHCLLCPSVSHEIAFAFFAPIAALASDPEALKVRDWRHKLQKAFLSKALPKEEVSLTVSMHHALFSHQSCTHRTCLAMTSYSKQWKHMRS